MEPYVWTSIRMMLEVGFVIVFLSFMYFLFQLVISEFMHTRWKWISLVAGDVEARNTICCKQCLYIVCKTWSLLGFCIENLLLVLNKERVNAVVFCTYDFFQIVVRKARIFTRDL